MRTSPNAKSAKPRRDVRSADDKLKKNVSTMKDKTSRAELDNLEQEVKSLQQAAHSVRNLAK
eukprot:CAMPEP_0113728518 /NCGR_PEP_ID=MMETSP0038_2-20120614/41942_1 /TAXON_ID=2898 /ORGANISM="Cryptomonas paramecium" /LENGTH=61 /DNA_ID=CAMNT_0000660065 /DNA_START=22 /DNA_END=204 /DNA_ORIENTATION=- /assembly_acc=CAM_ASM_000170